jgi:hypothetical protein
MSEVILYEIGNDALAQKALKVAEEKITFGSQKASNNISKDLQSQLKEIDKLKSKLS